MTSKVNKATLDERCCEGRGLQDSLIAAHDLEKGHRSFLRQFLATSLADLRPKLRQWLMPYFIKSNSVSWVAS